MANEDCTGKAVAPSGHCTVEVEVQRKDPKGAGPIKETGAFSVENPQIWRVVPGSGSVGTDVKITGTVFGLKKGKVYLGELACKTKTWSMNPATNESEAIFLLPKGVTSGTFMLNVVNKVGRGRKGVTVP